VHRLSKAKCLPPTYFKNIFQLEEEAYQAIRKREVDLPWDLLYVVAFLCRYPHRLPQKEDLPALSVSAATQVRVLPTPCTCLGQQNPET
jgi:hypothetical protein